MSVLLFTGGGGAGSEALYRLLSAQHDVHFADADPNAKSAGVPDTAWHTIPLASHASFIESVTALCERLHVDVLAPGVDEELEALAAAAPNLPCRVLVPPLSFVSLHLDKLHSMEVLRAAGIDVPVTASAERTRVPFPCVVKPRRGRGSRHVAIVNSEAELQAHVLLSGQPLDAFIVQERLTGQEFTVTVVADTRGHLRAVVPVRVAVKRGITVRASTDDDREVIAACAAIHRANAVAGCFNIQLVKRADGRVKPFEINPRISTTTCLAIAAGVDVMGLYESTDEPKALSSFNVGMQLKRSWFNEFL